MHIAAITVCVDYAGYLAQSIMRWGPSTEDLLVVTTERDIETISLCERANARYFVTDAFYRGGAKFNKGAALAEAYQQLNRQEWVLFFDADIIPPPHWRAELLQCDLTPGNIYGATRAFDPGIRYYDPQIAGFFFMAHVSDPRMQIDPIVDTHFYHAGNYDTTFMERWAPENRIRLPLTVHHCGVPGLNWCGVGQHEAVNRLHAERRIFNGWQHETVEFSAAQHR